MAQMVEHAHEDDEIELLAQLPDVICRHLAEFNFKPVDLGGKAGLRQVLLVAIETKHTLGAAPLHLHRVKACIAADIEHGLAIEAIRNDFGEASPLHIGIVTQEMCRCGRHAIEIKIVKPRSERIDTLANFLARESTSAHPIPPSVMTEVGSAFSFATPAHSLACPWSPELSASSAIAVR